MSHKLQNTSTNYKPHTLLHSITCSRALNTILVPYTVRVRVNSSVRRAGRDRVRVSNQDVVETGYAPRSKHYLLIYRYVH
jgi:hypothetical protein